MSQQYPQQSPPPPGDGYSHEAPQGYENLEQAPPGVPPPPAQGPAGAAGRKKRAYAGQAYEFGAGANAALGGQQQGGAPSPGPGYGGFSSQQDAAGYPQGGYGQNPAAVQQGSVPMYGGQDAGAVGGYQPPAPAYPAQVQPNVAGMTQQFGQMDMAQKPQQPQAAARAPVLNQLYPTDLSNQPFNVAELDYPPPPAVLPPNVSTSR